MIKKITAHYIKQLHGESLPERFLCLDTETCYQSVGIDQRHRMKIAWTCYVTRDAKRGIVKEKWRCHSSTYELWRYVEACTREKATLYLFGHNVYFDLQCSDFFPYMTAWGWKRDFDYDNGTTYILCVRNGSSTIKILSTTNFFVNSLRELGAMIGRHKGEPEFSTVDDGTLLSYCFRDTEITVDLIDRYLFYISENDLGSFGMSRASQAYRAYRHRFMSTKILWHSDADIQDLEKSAYFGGRTEAWYIGECKDGPFVKLDVNSMYPYIMAHTPLPCSYVDYHGSMALPILRAALRDQSAIAEVEIQTETPLYAVRNKDRIVFPVGCFTAFLCTEGLKQAIQRRHIKEVKRVAFYRQDILFREYVDYFYALRIDQKKSMMRIEEQASKIMLNSLYGKFGTQEEIVDGISYVDSQEYSRKEIPIAHSKLVETTTIFMGVKTVTIGKRPIKQTVLSIPSHITEYGRMMLWTIMETVGIENVLYVDTDSIVIRYAILYKLSHLIDSTKIGSLKIESISNLFTIHGAKDYVTDSGTKIKGIPHRAKLIGNRTYEYDYFPRQRTHLIEQVTRWHIVRKIVKKISGIYTKGIVTKSGRVDPLMFPRDIIS